MKFLQVARLDDSDDHVYSPAAQLGEPAVTGSFVFTFSDEDPEALSGKQALAFRTGFLGIGSFGWSTVVRIVEITETDYEQAVTALAQYLVDRFGAPSLDEAMPFARQEAEYAASLCEHATGTLLTVERHADQDGIHEAFKRIQQKAPSQVADWEGRSGEVRIWDMFPDHGKV